MQTIIIHLDMNSYFASVEQQDYPEYRGKPLGVCEHLGGIIIAASIEAKKWGIKTGTPVWEARKLYPKIILSHTHPERYRHYNRLMVKVVGDYTDFVEKYSIDEVFLDVSKVCNLRTAVIASTAEAIYQKKDCRVGALKMALDAPPRPFGTTQGDLEQSRIGRNDSTQDPFLEAVKVAKEIKQRMKKEVGDYMTCSIGIAENKLLAKIASDLEKPDGLVVVCDESVGAGLARPQSDERAAKACPYNPSYFMLSKTQLYDRLSLTDIPGIANRQEKRLNELGIKTLKDLRDYPYAKLVAKFGIQGHHLHSMGQLEGSWKPQVEQDDKIKSIGHMYTLPQEYREQKYFVPVLYKLCEMVARRLRRQELMGNTISFYIRDKDYQSFGKDEKLGFYVYDGREIFLQCMRIFEHLMSAKVPQEFKLIGVTVAGLKPVVNQLNLFEKDEKRRKISFALDKINDKYGDFTVCRAPILKASQVFHDSIGFGRLREKHRMIDRIGQN